MMYQHSKHRCLDPPAAFRHRNNTAIASPALKERQTKQRPWCLASPRPFISTRYYVYLNTRRPQRGRDGQEVKEGKARETGKSPREGRKERDGDGGGGGGVSRCNNQLSRQASHLYCHSPLPPVTGELNETRPWRSSDLSSVPSSPTVTLHLPSSRRRTGSRRDLRDSRGWGGCKGGRAPGDHVSGSDLHYGTIERLLFAPGGGEEDWCFIFLFVSLPPSRPGFCEADSAETVTERNLCLTQANVISAVQAGGV